MNQVSMCVSVVSSLKEVVSNQEEAASRQHILESSMQLVRELQVEPSEW